MEGPAKVQRRILHRSIHGVIEEEDETSQRLKSKRGTLPLSIPETQRQSIEEMEAQFRSLAKAPHITVATKAAGDRKGSTNINANTKGRELANTGSPAPAAEDKDKDHHVFLVSPSLKRLHEQEDGKEELVTMLERSNNRVEAIKKGATMKEVFAGSVPQTLPDISPGKRSPLARPRPLCRLRACQHRRRRTEASPENLSVAVRTPMRHHKKLDTVPQISYVSGKPMTPYVELESIKDIYTQLQDKDRNDTPFVQLLKNGAGKFLEFINFSMDRWIEDAKSFASPCNLVRRRARSLMRKSSMRTSKDSMLELGKEATAMKFAECIFKFTEQAKKEKKAEEDRQLLPKLNGRGIGPAVQVLLDSSLAPNSNSIAETRNVCKGFYSMKMHLRRGVIKTLEALDTERPYATSAKQQFMAKNTAGGLHASEEMRKIRVMAERQRADRYKSVVKDYVTLYYRLVGQMFIQKLPLTQELIRFSGVDQVKHIIESGLRLGPEELGRIMRDVGPERLSKEETAFFAQVYRKLGVDPGLMQELFGSSLSS